MSPAPHAGKRVRLRPHDAFDLIRLLARSQSDPRKAVAELVQNSLDARAAHVELAWFSEKGRRCLRVRDDGEGIFPERGREEALRTLAQTIGHSHKRHIDASERHKLLMLGQYGIGLLGFWSVGEEMVITSRVGGGTPWCLRLVTDRKTAEVYPWRSRRVDDEETYTRITIRGVHPAAERQVRPVRLSAYLASELRGQLLERGTELLIHDKVARGRARKLYRVEAHPYLGVPLSDFTTLAVAGCEDARPELYLVPPEEDRTGCVALASCGAVVLDDLAFVAGHDLPRPPWSSGRLEGVVDFPDLAVAPGTRRGFVPNEASEAFLIALEELEPRLEALLADERRRSEVERERTIARDIRRAFRGVARELPELELFEVRAGGAVERPEPRPPDGAAVDPPEPDGGDAASAATEESPPRAGEPADGLPDAAESDGMLFPPGPPARIELKPTSLRVPPGARRTLRARVVDADGRRAQGEPHAFAWTLQGPGTLAPEGEPGGARAALTAPDHAAQLLVRVAHAALSATCRVEVDPDLAGRERAGGIPEPERIDAPSEPWRSRMLGDRWQFNAGHPDYRVASGSESARLRYLIHLFAKELVLRNFGRPGDGDVLERMVQILTRLNLRGR